MVFPFGIREARTWTVTALMTGTFLSTLGCTSVERAPVSLEEAMVESPFGKVQLEFAGSIGSEDKEGYFFSIIRGIEIDKEDNVVVFDGLLRNIRVFSPAGDLIRTYELPEGEGPGEFSRASTFSLSADKERILLYDQVNRRITILDYVTFEYINSFSLSETNHATIYSGPDNTILAVYDQLSLGSRPLVHVFTEHGTKLAAFDGRHEKFAEFLQQGLQVFHEVSLAQSDSLIFLSFALPYEIRTYDRHYELLRRFHRTPNFFGGTVRDGEWIYPSGYCTSIVVAGDELVLQLVTSNREEEELWVHAFDFSGNDRGIQNMSRGEWGTRFYLESDAVDSRGNLYGVTYTPFPRLIRFRVVSDSSSA